MCVSRMWDPDVQCKDFEKMMGRVTTTLIFGVYPEAHSLPPVRIPSFMVRICYLEK